MDNKIFNVNGSGQKMLEDTLQLVFFQSSERTVTKSWSLCPKKGLILYWSNNVDGIDVNSFLTPLTAEEVTPMVWAWLNSDGALVTEMIGYDKDADHDGSNSLGWRVFVEDWGHINGSPYAICAIKPAYMWHGK